MKEDPQDLSMGKIDNSSALLCEAKEDIQPHDQSSQEKENNFCSIQRKQRLPPPLTEEEINQILSMQPASKFLSKEEIIFTCSTADLCTEAFPHEETKEQIDTDVVLSSQEGLLSESAPIHQNDGLQT